MECDTNKTRFRMLILAPLDFNVFIFLYPPLVKEGDCIPFLRRVWQNQTVSTRVLAGISFWGQLVA